MDLLDNLVILSNSYTFQILACVQIGWNWVDLMDDLVILSNSIHIPDCSMCKNWAGLDGICWMIWKGRAANAFHSTVPQSRQLSSTIRPPLNMEIRIETRFTNSHFHIFTRSLSHFHCHTFTFTNQLSHRADNSRRPSAHLSTWK